MKWKLILYRNQKLIVLFTQYDDNNKKIKDLKEAFI